MRGWAGPELLATYEAERRPQAEHNVVRSADPFGSRREVITEMQVDLAGRIRHEWLEPARGEGRRRRSTPRPLRRRRWLCSPARTVVGLVAGGAAAWPAEFR